MPREIQLRVRAALNTLSLRFALERPRAPSCADFVWTPLTTHAGATVPLNLDSFGVSLLRVHLTLEDDREDEPFKGEAEVLAAVDRIPRK